MQRDRYLCVCFLVCLPCVTWLSLLPCAPNVRDLVKREVFHVLFSPSVKEESLLTFHTRAVVRLKDEEWSS